MQLLQLIQYFLVLTFTLFQVIHGQLTVDKSLKIPKRIPKNTFVVQTVENLDTVDYGADYDAKGGAGTADGVCKQYLHLYHSPQPKNVFISSPCLLPISATREQDVVATCRVVGSSAVRTGAKVAFQLYIDSDTNKTTASFQVTGNAWYGFGNGNGPLTQESKDYTDPDSTILINCIDDKRSPIRTTPSKEYNT